ncbi:cell wall-binding repeat-containing protein [Herbiconiux liangxiaofengii]|uniref:cell wall-binding repeat-containing protein n=1 Tax=Herbiconiux liangxiaofengii TaxID=3342795 RepID=UPI0035B72483
MKPHPFRARTALATGVAAALALSAVAAAPAMAAPAPATAPGASTDTAATAAAAAAAATPISDAVFTWALNNESGNKAYAPGTFNLLSAGILPKTSAADTVTSSEWKATDGNVTIQKNLNGAYSTATWAGLTTDTTGAAIVSPTSGKTSGNRVSIAAGTGTVDPAAENADIQWDGDFTVAFYSGMTQFSASDPHLVVENGVGTVTATLNGYGTDMTDTTEFSTLPATEVVLADLLNVDVTATGFEVAPEYLGVTLTLPEGTSPQNTSGATSGAFPQSFVDYQLLTGQSSYWYSSGAATDAGKVALPIAVGYTQPAPAPKVTVSKVDSLNPLGDTITVTGTGFAPNAPATNGARPPFAGQFGGVYVAFGTFLDTWKPSEGAPSSARKTLQSATKWGVTASQLPTIGTDAGIVVDENGGFSTTLTVSRGFAGALSAGNYGIYTYPGSGATYAPFETYTPLTFALAGVDRIDGADRLEVATKVSQQAFPSGADTAYLVNGYVFSDALSAAPAAVSDDAPLLLTAPDALSAGVEAELKRLDPSTIVVVGGPASVSEKVISSLKSIAGTVTRIAGADRYSTSIAVAEYAFGGEGDSVANAYLATGTNFPDALSASAAAGTKGEPVILVHGPSSAVDAATAAAITGLGASSVTIAGGPASVSAGIQTSLASVEGVESVTRLDGPDRFAASISINNAAFDTASQVFLATGFNYPDALAGAALAGSLGAPLYVVPTDCVPSGVLTAVADLGADAVTLLGGPVSLSQNVAELKACSF